MTDFFETRVENLKPKEEKKKSSADAKKTHKKAKKKKREDSDSSVVESSEESTEARGPSKKAVFYTVNAVILVTIVKIYVQWSTSTCKTRKNFRTYWKSKKELNIIIEKNSEVCEKNNTRKTEKEFWHFQKM